MSQEEQSRLFLFVLKKLGNSGDDINVLFSQEKQT